MSLFQLVYASDDDDDQKHGILDPFCQLGGFLFVILFQLLKIQLLCTLNSSENVLLLPFVYSKAAQGLKNSVHHSWFEAFQAVMQPCHIHLNAQSKQCSTKTEV